MSDMTVTSFVGSFSASRTAASSDGSAWLAMGWTYVPSLFASGRSRPRTPLPRRAAQMW